MKDVLIQTQDLCVHFPVKKGLFSKKSFVHAVDNVNIEIEKGESLGVVGESGCGKTTLANALIGLVTPTSGRVLFKDKEIYEVDKGEYKELRKDMQMIFQDPFSSLNPRFTVHDIIAEPYVIRKKLPKEEITKHVVELLKMVGLSEKDLYRHPTDFSGGQRQRIVIARAIALNPEFLICDEPVSALDVSVHSQILNLLMDLQKELKLTYLFISHNLAVVNNVCTKVAVMYLGNVVEYGTTKEVFENPMHPYTKALLSAVADINDNADGRIVLEGDIPSPIDMGDECVFCQRCYERCDEANMRPPLVKINECHYVACHKVKA